MVRKTIMKQVIMLEDETPKANNIKSASKEEQREDTTTIVINEVTALRSKGCLVADVHRSN